MNQIYCCPKKVEKLYLKRKKEGQWEEYEERDDTQFWNMERKIYKEMFPLNDGASNVDEGTHEEEDFEDVSDRMKVFSLGSDKSNHWPNYLYFT